MGRLQRIAIVSDVHYAGPGEQRRGNDYEYRDLSNPLQRLACHAYRRFLWLRNPLEHNRLLDAFLSHVGECDHVFALGDFSCDTAFVGVSDDAALESAAECLGKLRRRFGTGLHSLIGDHELGKFPMFGRRGGLRFESWRRVRSQLGLSAFWQVELEPYVCFGVTSTLVMLPAFAEEILDAERADWEAARAAHLDDIRRAFDALHPGRPILLFCHDPSALPYLWNEPAVRRRLEQVRATFVGHLHSPLILWKSRRLAGMPTVSFLGHTAQRLSTALGRARLWAPFKVHLCPSLAGIELLKDGGFCMAELGGDTEQAIRVSRHRLHR